MADIKIDRSLFTRQLLAIPRNRDVAEKIVNEYVSNEVNEARVDFLVELDKHEVTKEIKAGPDAANTSGLLGGVGNLFSFIGFGSNKEPIKVLKSLFMKKTGVTKVKLQSASKGRFIVQTNIPSREEVFEKTPIPWEKGRSWLDGIEKGISGLGKYRFGIPEAEVLKSRSRVALQGKKKLRSGNFRPTSYFTELYNRFLKRLYTKR